MDAPDNICEVQTQAAIANSYKNVKTIGEVQ